jgi:branched-chain amino acid aminotransferase
MDGPIWVNGRLVGADQATLSVLDHGFTVGDGVFETLKVVIERPSGGERTDGDGRARAFALRRHLRRLRRSAAGLGLAVEGTDDELRAAVAAVLDASAAATWADGGRLRVTVTGGVSPLGSGRGDAPASVVVAAGPARPVDPTIAVATVPWRRNEHSPLAGLKCTSYAENVVALRDARARGAGEAVLANTAGHLCEGTGTNVFVGRGGRLVTPPLSSGCLAGVTRDLLLELVDVVEEDLPLSALAEADEAFLTSSTRGVHPVAAVDGTPLPRCPGPLTAAAGKAYDDLVASNLDP